MEYKIILNDKCNIIINDEIILNFKDIKHLADSVTSLGGYTNSFCIFNSIDNILSLIYTDNTKSIFYYNIIDERKITEIKNAHNNYINNFIYYFDKNNKRDLILSVSSKDNNIKLWNINNLDCLIDLKLIYKNGNILSACILFEGQDIFILASNSNLQSKEYIKVYDLNSNLVKSINDSNDNNFYIDSFYDKKWFKNYIVTCNKGYVKSYDYYLNKIYYIYRDENDLNMSHLCAIIREEENINKLYESCYDGKIRIWNFNTGELLKKISVYHKELYGMCFWNDKYLLVGCVDKTIKLVDTEKGIFKKNFFGHGVRVVSVKKIKHPFFGECFISQGADNNRILLWGYDMDDLPDEGKISKIEIMKIKLMK